MTISQRMLEIRKKLSANVAPSNPGYPWDLSRRHVPKNSDLAGHLFLASGKENQGLFLETILSGSTFQSGIYKTTFKRSLVEDARFNNAEIRDGEMVQTSFVNTHFKECQFYDVVFHACHLQNAIFENCEFGNCEFIRCNLEEAIFDGATMQNVLFMATRLRGTSFLKGYLNNFRFLRCSLLETNIAKDFRIDKGTLNETKVRESDARGWSVPEETISKYRDTSLVSTPTRQVAFAPENLAPEEPADLPSPHQRDMEDAAWRVAASQLVKLAQDPLVQSLRRFQPNIPILPSAQFFESDLGKASVSSLLSLGAAYLPPSPTSKRAAKELRLLALTEIGDTIADLLTVPLCQIATDYLSGDAPQLATPELSEPTLEQAATFQHASEEACPSTPSKKN
jgi:uncharacterized protein YjbI with pentapeptide repeats